MARASSVIIAPDATIVSIGIPITADIIAPNVEVRDTVGEVSQAPAGAPDPYVTKAVVSCGRARRVFVRAGSPLPQTQSLICQGLIFQGVRFSIRHCSRCSGGQWLIRDASLTTGAALRGITRRRLCRVASLIISTNSALSAMTGFPRNTRMPSHADQSAPNCLTTSFDD